MKNFLFFSLAHLAVVLRSENLNALSPNIVARSSWGAKMPTAEPVDFLNIPSTVIVYHSGMLNCYTNDDCTEQVRKLQTHDMDMENFIDIRANFLIGEDGNVYEGRGWKYASINSIGFPSKSIEICFLGNFKDIEPGTTALDIAKQLLEYGAREKKLSKPYSIILEREIKNISDSPEKLYESMKTWAHTLPILNIVTKSAWNINSRPQQVQQNISKIPSAVLISYVETSSCATTVACMELFQNFKIRNLVMSNKLYSDRSNFLIGEDGNIYEDAGWSDNELYNGESIKITLVGNFTGNSNILDVVKNLLTLGVALGRLDPMYDLYEHMDESINFRLPQRFRDIVTTWSHWQVKLSIVQRSEWGGEPIPLEKMDTRYLSSPIIIYQLKTPSCTSLDTCNTAIKNFQESLKSQWDRYDFPYNFLIDKAGNIYEGTGWYGIIKRNYLKKRKTLKICFIGIFDDRKRIMIIFQSMQRLLNYGTAIGMVDPEYVLYGIQESRINFGSINLNELIKALPNSLVYPNIIDRSAWDTRRQENRNVTVEILALLNRSNAAFPKLTTTAGANEEFSMEPQYRNEMSPGVIIFNVPTPNCMKLNNCIPIVQTIQDALKYKYSSSKIGYNFLIGEDGYVYEGTGWNLKGLYSITNDANVIEICIMGQFHEKEPDLKMLDAIEHLLEYGTVMEEISPSYVLYSGNSDYMGKYLSDVFETSPNWNEPPNIMTRKSWEAETLKTSRNRFVGTPSVIFISNVLRTSCVLNSSCATLIKDEQNIAMNYTNMTGVLYNFLISEEGYIYTGFGWEFQIPIPNIYEQRSIKIGFVGDFQDISSTSFAVENLRKFLKFGVIMNKLHPMYILYVDEMPTTNISLPKTMYNVIETLPQYRVFPNIIRRSSWDARPPKLPEMTYLPIASYAIVTDTNTWSCNTKLSCITAVKTMQKDYMRGKYTNDIKYNFIIDEDGNVYEGLGWHRQGNFLTNYIESSIIISVIGTYQDRLPNLAALNAIENLLALGVARNKLKSSYTLYTENEISQTAGYNKLYIHLRSSPHWQPYTVESNENTSRLLIN